MKRSIDDYDYDANKVEKKDYKFNINFKKIYYFNHELLECNGYRDEHYPKDILVQELFGLGIWNVILMALSYNILLIATIPFFFFNLLAFLSTRKVWKEFKYKMSTFWLISIAIFVVSIGVGFLLLRTIFY